MNRDVMNREEIKQIVHETVKQTVETTVQETVREILRDTVRESVKETMQMLGVKVEDPIEMQQDFNHLRKWRRAVDTAQSTSMLTALGILVTGAMGALWLGIQALLERR